MWNHEDMSVELIPVSKEKWVKNAEYWRRQQNKKLQDFPRVCQNHWQAEIYRQLGNINKDTS